MVQDGTDTPGQRSWRHRGCTRQGAGKVHSGPDHEKESLPGEEIVLINDNTFSVCFGEGIVSDIRHIRRKNCIYTKQKYTKYALVLVYSPALPYPCNNSINYPISKNEPCCHTNHKIKSCYSNKTKLKRRRTTTCLYVYVCVCVCVCLCVCMHMYMQRPSQT